MTTFDFSDEKLTIVDAQGNHVDLSPQEAITLLSWLSDHKTALLHFSQPGTNHVESSGEQLEIYFQQQDLIHLSTLQSAIPQLQGFTPAAKVFIAPMDLVTERAIQLLEAFQIEYKIHPLLEQDDEFAQG